MNKFALVFCLLLIVNFSQEVEINLNYETIYDALTNIIKGLSATNEGLCANVFIKNKSKMLNIVERVIDDLKSGKKFSDLLGTYSIELLGIENLLTDCRVFSLVPAVTDLISLNGIKGIGDRIYKNAETLYDYVQKFKSTPGLGDKLVYVGKALKIVLDIYVQ